MMNKHYEQMTTDFSTLLKRLCFIISCLLITLAIFIFISQFDSVPLRTGTLSTSNPSPDLFNLVLSRSDPVILPSSLLMNRYMRSIYGHLNDLTDDKKKKKRKKRQFHNHLPSLSLSEDTEMIISLPNQSPHSHFQFVYNGSLDTLAHVELILPREQFADLPKIHLVSKNFNLTFHQPFPTDRHWFKFNLTSAIRIFPQQFSIEHQNQSIISVSFLTLYFRRSTVSHGRSRRDLSLLEDPVTINDDEHSPECAVRPLRVTFAELNWTSWIVEPTSYEMNICSGTCSTRSTSHPYFRMQTLLHRLSPKTLPESCCRPKRFSSTILLYYDGANLILKRFENMRVTACSCFDD